MITKAMILAAGRGERLRPITDSIPKPLVDVGGASLVAHHICRLAAAGIKDIVINTAWLGEKLEEAVKDGSDFGVCVSWSREPAGGLETAGGLRRALALLGDEPFLVVNGDTYMDADYGAFDVPEGWKLAAHLWLVANPKHHPQGDFSLENGLVRPMPRYTFSGAAVYNPEHVARIPDARGPLKPWFERWMEQDLVSGQLLSGAWFDVGTVQRLEETRTYALAHPNPTLSRRRT